MPIAEGLLAGIAFVGCGMVASAAQEGLKLEAPELLQSVDEFGDGCGVQIVAVFPSFVLQQIRNSLAVRRIVPQGAGRTELIWTAFGFADDSPQMTEMRLRQGVAQSKSSLTVT